MTTLIYAYFCECGKSDCDRLIKYTEQSNADFAEYCHQRDSYCLISKSCKRVSEILPEKIAVEGEDYLIVEA